MTMKTPEMEVVRFNEADVLAASGIQSFALKNWNNGPKDDATVNGIGKDGALSFLSTLGEGYTFQYGEGGQKVSASHLYDYEETGTILDGIYTKDGETNWMCHQ